MSQASPRLSSAACRWSAVLTCCLGPLSGLAGCGKSQPKGPVTAESSAYQVDEGSPESKAAARAATAPPAGSAIPAADPYASVSTNLNDPPNGSGSRPATRRGEPVPTSGQPADPSLPGGPGVNPPRTSPGLPGPNNDSYAVPTTKAALLTFLQELRTRRPQGTNQTQLLDDFRKIQGVRIAAADKLASLSAEKQDRLAAAMSKVEALRELSQLGPEYQKELHGYCRVLLKDKDADIARLGRLVLFSLAVDDLVQQKGVEVAPIFDELKSLVADSAKDPGVFLVASQAAMVMQQLGHKDLAKEAFQLLGTTYQDSQDPEVQVRARELLLQVKVFDVDLYAKVNAMMKGEPNSVAPVLDALKSLLSSEQPDAALLDFMGKAVRFIEMARQYETAAQAYALVEATFKNSPDKKLADEATASAERGRRRAALVGQPFTVTGVQLDGTPFDWSRYRGKVVLVNFWATSSEACLAEISNLHRVFTRYHDKGFEVVGVCLDQDPKAVEQFLEPQPLPWPMVLGADPAARGLKLPLAVQCGIDDIPFMVLVDPSGKVKEIHVRGAELDRQLAALLGPVGPEAKTLPAQPDRSPAEPDRTSQPKVPGR
ncbi:MAG: redoxin family protein [Planctomycetota bacterium]|nr:redoxin family protein [Planctomycetota bacterium]